MEKIDIDPADETFVVPTWNAAPATIAPVDLSPLSFELPGPLAVAADGAITVGGVVLGAVLGGWVGAVLGAVLGGIVESEVELEQKVLDEIGPDQPASPVEYATNHFLPYLGSGRPYRGLLRAEPLIGRYALAAIGRRMSGVIDLVALAQPPKNSEADYEISDGPGPAYKQPRKAVEPKPKPTLNVNAHGLARVADTLVTGRSANGTWRQDRGYDDGVAQVPFSQLADAAVAAAKKKWPSAPPLTHRDLVMIEARLGRIQQWIEAGPTVRATMASSLGWILTFAEKDPPHRPINAVVTADRQFAVSLTVQGVDTRIRYAVTQPRGRVTPDPSGRVFLMLHGHSSRIEETDLLRDELAKLGHTSYALDLPGCGYSRQLDPDQVAMVTSLGDKGCVAFYDHVVERFITDVVLPGNGTIGPASGLHAVCGGSLGGNLVMRMARRDTMAMVRRFVAWSPACVWDMGDGDRLLSDIGLSDRLAEPESTDERRKFFHYTFSSDFGKVRQAEQWYRNDWPHKATFIGHAWADRHELYSTKFRRWHWKVALEQVEASHRRRIAAGETYSSRLVLMTGAGDDFDKTQIFSNVAWIADQLPAGRAYFWKNCGHSIQSEYPKRLAEELHLLTQLG